MDVRDYTNVGSTQFVVVQDLHLLDGQTYYASVKGPCSLLDLLNVLIISIIIPRMVMCGHLLSQNISATDHVGHTTVSTSLPVKVDSSPPDVMENIPHVTSYYTSKVSFHAQFDVFKDEESGMHFVYIQYSN